MNGSKRAPLLKTFDERFPLAEALERALATDDGPSSLTVTTLAELPSLVKLARRVEGSAQAVGPSDAFRLAARTRLVATMREAAASSAAQVRQSRHQPWNFRLAVSGWFARLAAALSAVALAGAATASASASALPGDPLYGIKQVAEQVALVTAADDAARQQVLVRQADTRLEETSRLLDQGRDAEAGQNALRYSEVVERATGAAGVSEAVETSLQADSTRLASLLAQAPPPARPGLQRALEAAQRGQVRLQQGAHTEVNARPTQPRSAVVQQASDVRLEATPTPAPTPSPMTAGPAADDDAATPKSARESADSVERHEAVEPRVDTAPQTIDGGHAAGGAPRPVAPPERPASSAPAVDTARGAPVTPVHPTQHGRP